MKRGNPFINVRYAIERAGRAWLIIDRFREEVYDMGVTRKEARLFVRFLNEKHNAERLVRS